MSYFRRSIPSLRDPQQQLREAQENFAARLEALEKELAVYKEKGEDDDDSALTDADHEPIWDEFDQIHRCHDCRFELHIYSTSERSLFNVKAPSAADSVSTNNEAVNLDRTSQPRGTTPLLEVPPQLVPRMYTLREDEYEELLARGATRLMCETFELQFTPDIGIVAWADQDLFDEFTGEGMKRGDRWKIRLGRRVELDVEDLDGSQFIEDFLEDAVVFPLYLPYGSRSPERWETVEVTPGVWETRLVGDVGDQAPQDADSAVNEADDGEDDCDPDSFMYDPNEPVTLEGRTLGRASEEGTAAVRTDVVVQAGYESPGDEESDTMAVDEGPGATDDEDPGWEINDITDTDWPESDKEDEEDNDEAAAPESDRVEVEDAVQEGKYADDSADSDFDSDEELSGDEDALRGISFMTLPTELIARNLYYSL
ncbi:hypothetical protein EYR40_006038 [Pleurotus pulmonarius]|nr:hypothetical protein EYR36_005581 [Pleurotus pulmonarius]KAF4602821.1 hypothetical protein EYR40_006038 [Pleurotus pulmonarius]